jgi:hypothetical protein
MLCWRRSIGGRRLVVENHESRLSSPYLAAPPSQISRSPLSSDVETGVLTPRVNAGVI